jgi:hypothetical protein
MIVVASARRRLLMQSTRFVHAAVIVCAVGPALAIAVKAPAAGNRPNMFGFADPSGIVRTWASDPQLSSINFAPSSPVPSSGLSL